MKTSVILLSGIICLFSACSPSTKIEKTWVDPSINPTAPTQFKKLLMVALLKDESTRRITEDKMVAASKVPAVQSYNYLKPGELAKEDSGQVKAKLQSDGFDGVVLMQLTTIEKDQNYVPGTTTYGGWYGHYRYSGGMYSSPGYYTTDKTYVVETNVYSIEPAKLLWAGTTSTLNPSKTDKAIDDIIKVVKEEMAKKGLVSK